MKRICDVCGGEIPENKRADAKVCSNYCRVKKYTQTETGKLKSVEKTRRYQVSEKGRKNKKKVDSKYYNNHKEKWYTPEMLRRGRFNTKARQIIKDSKRPHICVECGEGQTDLDVHHIDMNWENNDDILNLEYRCEDCHNRIHGKVRRTIPATDIRRKVQYTEDEIMQYLKQAANEIGYIPFTQTSYTKLGKGRPTAKTITKHKSWNEWMELISK